MSLSVPVEGGAPASGRRCRDAGPVEELLARHGYVRPWEVRNPATPRQIVAVFRDLSGPYTLEVVRGIVDAAADFGADVVTGTTGKRSISQWLEECVALGAAGLIIVISMLAEDDQRRIVEQRLPVVLVDPLSAPTLEVPSIGVTNRSGARDAVQHLLGAHPDRHGRGPAALAGRGGAAARIPHRTRRGRDRLRPRIVRSTDFVFDEARVAGLQILRGDDPPTAVFAASDAQALGVLEAVRRQGLSVPDDLTVMSFDDTLAAAMASPPLSAVRQPFGELGHEATRVLMQMAEARPPASPRIELPTQLVLRASTAGRRHGC